MMGFYATEGDGLTTGLNLIHEGIFSKPAVVSVLGLESDSYFSSVGLKRSFDFKCVFSSGSL